MNYHPQRVFTRRALRLGTSHGALFGLLADRLYYLQVVESDKYALLADENRISMRLLSPRRGRILDRWGTELATNRRNYRSEEHTSELQSLMRISYAVFCLKKKKNNHRNQHVKISLI